MKVTRYILVSALCSLLFILTGCRPKGILHSWEMREVLVDLHKTDAMLQINGLQYGHDEAKKIYYAQVLEKHGISQAQFDSSLVWYTAHPQLFDKIYPKVLAELKQQEDLFIAQNEEALNSITPFDSDSQKEKAPEYAFTRQELDSILWVTQHGYCTPWLHWERPAKPLVLIDR